MKAPVLTYDENHPLTHHMIETYENKWPHHPFTFIVPYNNQYPSNLKKKYGNKVEIIQTKSPIRSTVLTLLEEVADNEWIYWTMDDKYIIDIDIKRVQRWTKWILNGPEPDIDGLSIARARYLLSGEALDGTTITTSTGMKLHRRKDYRQIWLPQFLKSKVLKYLFKNMPEPDYAKQMDELKFEAELPNDHKLFVTDRNHVVLGESTRRGELTQNCAESLQDYGIDPPETINEICDQKTVGDLRKYRNLLYQWDFTRSIWWNR